LRCHRNGHDLVHADFLFGSDLVELRQKQVRNLDLQGAHFDCRSLAKNSRGFKVRLSYEGVANQPRRMWQMRPILAVVNKT